MLEFVTEYYYAFAASCWNASLSTSRPPFDFRLFARAKTLNQGKLTISYWRATSDPAYCVPTSNISYVTKIVFLLADIGWWPWSAFPTVCGDFFLVPRPPESGLQKYPFKFRTNRFWSNFYRILFVEIFFWVSNKSILKSFLQNYHLFAEISFQVSNKLILKTFLQNYPFICRNILTILGGVVDKFSSFYNFIDFLDENNFQDLRNWLLRIQMLG